nr:SprT family zinc-dependent metalloprotease [uncultured Sphingosinicella sp.]
MKPARSSTIWSSVTSELSFQGGTTSATLTLRPSPRARVMRLRVDPRTGAVVLTVPPRVSQRRALAWAAGQRAWIEAALADITPPDEIGPNSAVPLYGRPHPIAWEPKQARTPKLIDDRILVGGPAETLPTRLLRWLKQHALAVLSRETEEYAAKAGVTVSRVGVGDPLSRWGSCSSSGTIRYSWRLILAPDHVRRATVAHEVAHRVHMNHGPDFHALVARLFEADPKPARDWLRREGARLHRFGRGL